MSIVFLDERISIHSNNSNGTDPLSTTPLLIGDIGLQTGGAIHSGNAANVRIALEGTVGLTVDTEAEPVITLTIERNGSSTAGTGVLIHQQVFDTDFIRVFSPLSITAGDFPPAAAVLAGEIRYTLFISSTSDAIILSGPVAFNGSASAGTTTS
ncbi:hypothetical protein K0T92_15675 [Paenibacillus oenotherae]|uniref:Uncharacterized protein n=1 Tax=Paenibacillus oenotherae TaxID=1435645 RepID=A0ABS7DAK1_9BACL|nr:hypothetical protein [Paenibacillus oenotherae]MBW7476183.1 hypothetical protein [Paenibacillus oenotherae]